MNIRRLEGGKAMILACLILVGACAARPELPIKPVARTSDPLSIIQVHAYPAQGGVKVTGFVKRPPFRSGLLAGYIRVIARLADGKVGAMEYVRGGAVVKRAGKGGTFSVQLNVENAAAVKEIEVDYVATRDPPTDESH